MEIYLMRHAEAADPGAWRGPDRSRPLTDNGIERLKAALGHMRRARVSADALVTSPYERAIQTAETVASELHILQTIQAPELGAGASIDDYLEILGRHRDVSPLWLVGHMPEIAMVASRLTGDPAEAERGFAPGEMIAVDCGVDENGAGEGRTLWRRRLEQWAAA